MRKGQTKKKYIYIFPREPKRNCTEGRNGRRLSMGTGGDAGNELSWELHGSRWLEGMGVGGSGVRGGRDGRSRVR